MACHESVFSPTVQARVYYRKTQQGLTDIQLLGSDLTYSAAHFRETREAAVHGCRRTPSGDPGTNRHIGVWSVYHVWAGP